MNFIEKVKEKARKNIKKIVLPETMDRRVIEAGVKATEEKIAEIIFIGNEREIANQNPHLNLSQIAFIDPNEAELTVKLTEELYELRKNKWKEECWWIAACGAAQKYQVGYAPHAVGKE